MLYYHRKIFVSLSRFGLCPEAAGRLTGPIADKHVIFGVIDLQVSKSTNPNTRFPLCYALVFASYLVEEYGPPLSIV